MQKLHLTENVKISSYVVLSCEGSSGLSTRMQEVGGWHRIKSCSYPITEVEVCGCNIFATRPLPVAQDNYPYPTHTQNYYPTRAVHAGIALPVTVNIYSLCSC